MFQALTNIEKPTPPLTREPRTKWMSAMSLRLIDVKLDHHHQAVYNRNVTRTLTKAVRKSLMVDKYRRADTAAEEIGECLDTLKRDTIRSTGDIINTEVVAPTCIREISTPLPYIFVKDVMRLHALYQREDPPTPLLAHTNSRHPVQQ